MGAVLVVLMGLLLVIPTQNYHIKRMQSAFEAKDDASYQVRAENRNRILPFIYTHPIGGGLGSTGVWGMRFSPWNPLAQFAPDAGYMRVAVEMGWIGLLLYLTVLGVLFFYGSKACVSPYYHLKLRALPIWAALISLLVIEWAQDIIGKVPFNVFFWILMAILIRLPYLKPETLQSKMA
jgi:hypothetical protein